MTPSTYQLAISSALLASDARTKLRLARTPLVINARAGSGKTTTIKQSIRALLSQNPALSIAYCAYNKRIADDFKHSFEHDNRVQSSTAHSFGLTALRNSSWKYKINKFKLFDLFRFKKHSFRLQYDDDKILVNAVTLAKDIGIGLDSITTTWPDLVESFQLDTELPEGSRDAFIEDCKLLLDASIREKSELDFSDMIYLPLYYKLAFPQFDFVFIDEAQDTNATRRAMYLLMRKPWGTICAVGDDRQAIYGFTGASHNSMDIFQSLPDAQTLPLSICYRCDENILLEARSIVPDIESKPNNPLGLVRSIEYKSIESEYFSPHDAILCRLNAPLISLAFRLYNKKIECSVAGRELGYALVKLIESFSCTSISELSISLTDWYIKQKQTNSYQSSSARAATIDEKHECLSVAIHEAILQELSIKRLCSALLLLFTDKPNSLTLSSIHKAKGREFPRVYLLGRSQLMPYKRAQSVNALKQEHNLIYVALTRAQHELVYVNNIPL